MKILYVISKPNVGGIQTTTRNRIKALQKWGMKAEVAFSEQGDGEYIFKEIPHFFINDPNELTKKISVENYNYISFIYSLNYLPYLPNDYKGKIIYELRGWSPGVIKEMGKIHPKMPINGLVCIAKYLTSLVVPYISSSVPIFVDGNTVDPMFRYLRPGERIRKEYPKPSAGRSIIAFVGRVEEQKNWREFVSICRKVSKIVPIEAWIICNPNTSKKLSQMLLECKKNNIASKAFQISYDAMPEIYSTIADSGGCVLSTSIREGLGNSILEPMACSCPVVSSNIPGKNEIISHKHNGMLYPSGNSREAAECVRRIVLNCLFRQKIIRNALTTIRESYSQEKYAINFLSILSKL